MSRVRFITVDVKLESEFPADEVDTSFQLGFRVVSTKLVRNTRSCHISAKGVSLPFI
jgi:hypothetical protein